MAKRNPCLMAHYMESVQLGVRGDARLLRSPKPRFSLFGDLVVSLMRMFGV